VIVLPLALAGVRPRIASAQQPANLDEFLARPECRTPAPDSSTNLISIAARGSSEVEPEFFCFAIDSTAYGLNLQGEGTALGPHSEQLAFSIPIEEGSYLEGLMYKRYKNVLYVFYEVGNGEDSHGLLDAISLPALKPRWIRGVHTTFNLSPVLLTDTVAYLSSLDFVAKVDLHRGTVLWRHLLDVKAIRHGRHLQSFYAPYRLGSSLVAFPENVESLLERNRPDTVVLEDVTGRIVSPAGLRSVPIPW